MIAAGIDVGSVSTKVVLVCGHRTWFRMAPTGWSPREAGWQTYQALLGEAGVDPAQVRCVVGTGYGRISLPFLHRAVTEITCHARGAAHLVPGGTLVVDVGGQDSKVIRIDERGRVLDFAMNDKCAAGTGRFLQVIAAALGLEVDELSAVAQGSKPLPLSSMCAVFAESEVIGQLAAGKDKGEIVAGLHQAIARRLASMAHRLGRADSIVFTGGVAQNRHLCEMLQAEIGVRVVVPQHCQFTGALGAALLAWEQSA